MHELVIYTQDIDNLNQQLALAEGELRAINQKILRIKDDIAIAQIEQIHRKIDQFHKDSTIFHNSLEESVQAFDQDREILDQIINSNPLLAPMAQAALDEILILITSLKNQG